MGIDGLAAPARGILAAMAKPAHSPDFTGSKQTLTQFKPGISGNPAGRPKGAKSRFSEDFIGDVHAAWLEHGPEALKLCAVTEPGRFFQICASLMPKDLNISTANSVKVALDAVAAFRVLAELPAPEVKLVRDAAAKAE
jgi:hypothetical protein